MGTRQIGHEFTSSLGPPILRISSVTSASWSSLRSWTSRRYVVIMSVKSCSLRGDWRLESLKGCAAATSSRVSSNPLSRLGLWVMDSILKSVTGRECSSDRGTCKNCNTAGTIRNSQLTPVAPPCLKAFWAFSRARMKQCSISLSRWDQFALLHKTEEPGLAKNEMENEATGASPPPQPPPLKFCSLDR